MSVNNADMPKTSGVPTSELGETKRVKEEALKQLRRLISEDQLLDCPADEKFLTKFLRGRKYDVGRAFKNITQYFMVRRDAPDLFDDLGPFTIPYDVACRQHHLVTVSRKTDPKGRSVIMHKLGAWNSSICSLKDFFRVGIVCCEYLLLREAAQINGVVFVMDFDGFGAQHLVHYTPSVVKRLFNLMQECYPVRIKALYVINNPALFDILFAIAKLFMKAKLLERTHLFGYDHNKIEGLVPDDLIPAKNGGSLESYNYDELENDLKNEAGLFKDMNRYGYSKADNEILQTRL